VVPFQTGAEKYLPQQIINHQIPKRKLNAKESADFLNVKLPTFYSNVSKGKYPVHKPPGSKCLFCFEDELIDFIESGRRRTNNEIEAEANKYLIKNKRS
jgi:predicted DNA-binding transcriptional regulator AlpA